MPHEAQQTIKPAAFKAHDENFEVLFSEPIQAMHINQITDKLNGMRPEDVTITAPEFSQIAQIILQKRGYAVNRCKNVLAA